MGAEGKRQFSHSWAISLYLLLAILLSPITAAFAAPLAWTAKASAPTAISRAFSGVVNGKLYVLGGDANSGITSAVQVYDPAGDTWQSASPLSEPRFAGSEAVQGSVIYLAGGGGSADSAQSLLAYDTTSGTSTALGNLIIPRARSAAAIVNNKLYVIGGSNSTSGVLNTIEEYDLGAGTGTIKATLPAALEITAAVALNGKIYIFGGMDSSGNPTSTCWEYDPALNTFSAIAPLPTPRAAKTALAYNGKIYLIGGITSSGFPPTAWTMEILEYDPASDSWTVAGTVPTSRYSPVAGIVDNTMYVIGGDDGSQDVAVNEAAALPVPAGINWYPAADMPTPRAGAASEIVDGRIFVLGGTNRLDPPPAGAIATVESYDPLSDTWLTHNSLAVPRFSAGSAVSGATIYLLGGTGVGGPGYGGPGYTNTVLAYDTATGTTSGVGALHAARFGADADIINNKIYVAGGWGDAGVLASVEEFDIGTGTTTDKSPFPAPRDLPAVVAHNGKLFILGGFDAAGVAMNNCWLYDPATDTYSIRTPMPIARGGEGAVVLNGRIYLLGGAVSPGPPPISTVSQIQEYDPATDSWNIVGSIPSARWGMVAEVVYGNIYLIGGSDNVQVLEWNETTADAPPAAPWTVYSSGPPVPNPLNAPEGSAVDWALSQHPQVSVGSYLKIGGIIYYVTGSTPDSWNGPAYAAAALQQCDQASGALLFDAYGNPLFANTGGMAGLQIELWIPVVDTIPPHSWAQLSGAMYDGWYTSGVTVTITSADNAGGSGVNRVEYAVVPSGTAPPSVWETYTAPFTISQDGMYDLYRRAVDNAGLMETTVPLSLSIDQTPPVTSATPGGTSLGTGWFSSDVTVTLSASDSISGVERSEYSLDGINWTLYNPYYPPVFSAEGTVTVYYRSKDHAGHIEAAGSLEVKIDREPPLTTFGMAGDAELLSLTPSGGQFTGHTGSFGTDASGRYLAFFADGAIHLRDLTTGITERLAVPTMDGQPYSADNLSVSADGRYVLYSSDSYNLLPPGAPIGADIYLFDRQTGQNELISLSNTGGTQDYASYNPSMSSDARFIVFETDSTNVVANDGNGWLTDIVVRDRQAGTIELISKTTDGRQATEYSSEAKISANGRYVVFYSHDLTLAPNADAWYPTNQIYIRDLQEGTTRLVSERNNGFCISPSVTPDGRYVAFVCDNVLAGNTDGSYVPTDHVYLRDMTKTTQDPGYMEAVSESLDGHLGNDMSMNTVISDDGRYVAFASLATNLVADDTVGGTWDIFVRDRSLRTTRCVTRTAAGEFGNGESSRVAINDAGNLIFFSSAASNLVEADGNSSFDVFASDRMAVSGTKGANGWYISDVTVPLTAIDAVSGVAGTYYRLLPDTVYATYTGSIPLSTEGIHQIAHYSADNAGNNEAVAVHGVKIDKAPPVTTAVLSGTKSGQWYTSPVMIDLPATDGVSGVAKTEYSFDGATWSRFIAQLTIASEGETTFLYRSSDVAGLAETTNQTTIRIDTVLPSSSITSPAAGATLNTAAVMIQGAATDVGSGVALVEVSLDGGNTWAAAQGTDSWSYSWQATANGSYTVMSRATDNAGNREMPSSGISFTMAAAVPTVIGYQPANGASVPVNASVQVTFDVEMNPATFTPENFTLSRFAGPAKAIAAGYYDTFALKDDGTVVAWGHGSYGQASVPPGLSGVVAVAAGGNHTVALKSNGTVVAWGNNESGQTTVPAGLSDVVSVAAGQFHTVALKSGGTVVAWGENTSGEATVPAGLSGVTAIAAGGSHTVALKNDGTVVEWGAIAAAPAGLSGVAAIAAGLYHTVALKNDGTVVAWGNNSNGQITVPAGLSGVTAVYARRFNTFALKNDGTVVAWGDNAWGQASVPAGLTGVIAVAAGDGHTAALKKDGTVVAWGGTFDGACMVPAVLNAANRVVAGSLTYNPATLTATLTPVSPLVDGVSYNVAVTGVRSQAGMPLAAPVSWSFTTTEARVSVAPPVLAFGNVAINATPAVQTVPIRNTGTAALVVSAINLDGSDAGQFTVTPGTCPSLTPTIAAGGSCTVNVAFAPTSTGSKSAALQIVSNATANPTVSISLSGAGAISYPLTVTFTGTGAGTITVAPSPPGTSCTGTCSQSFISGTVATITSTAGAGSIVAGWAGCDLASGNQCTVNVTEAKSVTAIFNDESTPIIYPADFHTTTIQLPKTKNWPDNPGYFLYECYDEIGNYVDCSGTGQDADIRAGKAWPNPQFTDNGNGTVTDNLTGLIWLQNADCFGEINWNNAMIAANSLANGQCGLNDGSSAGQWRLPTVLEMERLVRASWPATPDGPFTSLDYYYLSHRYWTSTTYAGSANAAWNVDLQDSSFWPVIKSYVSFIHLWPVRDGATTSVPKTGQTSSYAAGDDGALKPGVAWPTPRFTDNGNGTMTDMLTGLIWLKNANCFGTKKTWTGALAAANGLAGGTCGLTDGSQAGDWRLPSRREFFSLTNFGEQSQSQWLNAMGFADVQADLYWSSSTAYEDSPSHLAYTINMSNGSADWDSKGYPDGYAWPVRGGRFGSSVITVIPSVGYFEGASPGISVSRTIAIANTAPAGSSKLQVSSMVLFGAEAGQFGIDVGDGSGGSCGSRTPIIAAGSSCTVTVTLTPQSSGQMTAYLSVSGSDVNTPHIDIPLVANPYSITASVSGGNGSIASANPAHAASGATASFTLSPDSGFQPSGSVGGTCPAGSFSGNTYTTGAISADCSVDFSFVPIVYPLNISFNGTGSGTVSAAPAPPGTSCNGTCSQSFNSGTVVTLTASDGNGSAFTSWSGCDTLVGNQCSVTMNGARNVTATFMVSGNQWFIHSVGPPDAVPPDPKYAIDWDAAAHAPLAAGNYVKVGSTFHYVTYSGNGSWSGPSFNMAELQSCDQQSGAPLVDAQGQPLSPDLTGKEGSALVVYPSWPGSTGGVWAWGMNSAGQLGDGTEIDRELPVPVSGLADVQAIAAAMEFSLALKSDGTIWTWGENYHGGLGDGSAANYRNVPGQVPSLTNVSAIAAGWFHALALKDDGTLWSWGSYSANAPDFTVLDTPIPVQVTGVDDVKAFVGGDGHSLVVKNDGTVWAWGRNDFGQLGDGSTVNSPTPVQVAGLYDVVAVAAGVGHSMALRADGSVWTWGRNADGQLGDGTNSSSTIPVEVPGLTGVTSIFCGGWHSMALKSDGTVWAWGGNWAGQLGDGTNTGSSVPVQALISGVRAIDGECRSSLALKTDGTVWEWGTYWVNGAVKSSAVPVQVSGLDGVTAIAGNMDSRIALKGVADNDAPVFPASFHTGTVQLPRTGGGEPDFTCYNEAGNYIDCTGTGQEGATRAGKPWPEPRFTDNGDGTVKDHLTGLVWLQNANCFGEMGWNDAMITSGSLANGQCGLSDGSTAGQWRLPTVLELERLVKPTWPSFNPYFTPFQNYLEIYTLSHRYWTSTTQAGDAGNAWNVDLADSSFWPAGKEYTTYMHVWPVRDGAATTVPKSGQNTSYAAGDDGALKPGVSWPSPRFIDNGNGTVTDLLTGLIWLKDANCFGTRQTWQGALDAASALAGGACALSDGSQAGDWRIPSRRELFSLVNFGEANQASWLNAQGGISNVQADNYWTSNTASAVNAEDHIANTINMLSGSAGWDVKVAADEYAWPVRGGQFGNSAMTVLPAAVFFPDASSGAGMSRTVTIANSAPVGSSRLHISSIVLIGADAGQFLVNVGDGSGGSCGSTTPILAAGSSCSITVTLTAPSSGQLTAYLSVSGSDVSSPYLDIPLVVNPHSVTATVSGGNGTVASANPAYAVTAGTASFALAPTAGFQPSSSVGGSCPAGSWSGNIYTTGAISADCSVDFSFVPVTSSYPLSVTISGSGQVHSAPAPDINCFGGTCSQSYESGSSVQLTATPASGWSFAGWTGCEPAAANECTVSITGAIAVQATFVADAPPVQWATKAPLPVAVARAVSGAVNGQIYVIGGNQSDGTTTAAVQVYDTTTNSWQPRPSFTVGLVGAASVTSGDAIYVAGGDAGTGAFSAAIFRYDIPGGVSTQIGSLVTPRFRMNAALLNGKMYVVGGIGQTGVLDTIEEVDLSTGISTVKAVLPEPRTLAGVNAVNGLLYIFGGSNNGPSSAVTWEYNPVTNQFTTRSPMPIADEVRPSAQANGRIYAVGGMNQGQLGSAVQVYDPPLDQWTQLDTMPTVRFASVAEVVDGTLYVMGGFDWEHPALDTNEAFKISNPWVVYHVGPPDAAPTDPKYAMNWDAASHGLIDHGNWVKIGGTMYYVMGSNNGSWDGPAYYAAGLQQCDQLTGVPLYDGGGQPLLPDLRGSEGSPLELYTSWPAPPWTVYSSGPPVPNQWNLPANSAIDWQLAAHGPLATGNYLKIAGIYYYVLVNPTETGSWSGPSFAAAVLQQCDQATGAPLFDGFGNPVFADTSAMPGQSITLYAAWPFPPADTTPTVTTPLIDCTMGDNGWCASNATVTLSAADTESGLLFTEYRIGDGSWANYSGPFTISTQGVTTVHFRSKDKANNLETEKQIDVKIEIPFWRSGGPNGGNVRDIVFSPAYAADRTVFSSGFYSGIYRSTDGGGNWVAVTSELSNKFVTALAVSPLYDWDHTIFAGTSEGLYRSADAGTSWTLLNTGIVAGNAVIALAVSPDFVHDGIIFAGANNGGLYRSNDGGESWSVVKTGGRYVSIATSPNFAIDRTVYAGDNNGGGVFRSTDGGLTWSACTRLSSINNQIVSLAVTGNGIVFATSPTEGTYRSTDGGQTWSFGVLNPMGSLAVSPNFASDGTVFAGSYRSTDGGTSWTQVVTNYVNAIAVSPAFAADRTVLMGADIRGISRSTDGGITWTSSTAGILGLNIVTVATSPAFSSDRTLFAAADSGGVFRSTDGGASWQAFNAGITEISIVSLSMSPNYANDNTVFAASRWSLYKSANRGESWTFVKSLSAEDIKAVVLSPNFAVDHTVLMMSQANDISQNRYVYRSTDDGATWQKSRSLSGSHDPYQSTMVLSPSFGLDQTAFTYANSLICRSTDGGQNWSMGSVGGGYVYSIALSPNFHTDKTIYAGTWQGISRSMDGGTTWTVLSNAGLPLRSNGYPVIVYALGISGNFANDHTIFAGTDNGVFQSTDGGNTWNAINVGLSGVKVRALALSPSYSMDKKIFAGAYYGSVWAGAPASFTAPIASFIGTPLSGYAPLLVTFTDTSINTPTSWSWKFGDGSKTVTIRNPLHAFSKPGIYTIKLTVSNPAGSDTREIYDYISVQACPNQPVRVGTDSQLSFDSLQSAYDTAVAGDTILVQAKEFDGDIQVSRDISVTLQGGYDCGYTTNPAAAAINGALRVSAGTVKVENLSFK